VSAKRRRNGRSMRRTRFCFIAEGRYESQQASQQHSRRQRLGVFEQAPPDGAGIATIKVHRLPCHARFQTPENPALKFPLEGPNYLTSAHFVPQKSFVNGGLF